MYSSLQTGSMAILFRIRRCLGMETGDGDRAPSPAWAGVLIGARQSRCQEAFDRLPGPSRFQRNHATSARIAAITTYWK